ncbi:N-methyl-L-tryptophan oxidase [Phreatobacter stygius]|uniref:N-methyl-L-tryptophan oxidase n=1 Tax=Phreatobacter stygius TaxID=1940610 RepID=A0A4D7B8G1_9HYPH|nr:N-methyl-L-tryptophan oxidase [Phreatobacter stygius]QCI66720.1 N-methyl-L-tryptophan oxidase [Phreatobacter stygius]
MPSYDVIVAGVGAMGSAAYWQLARRGQRVLGLERFDIPHAMGSSHGINRIIRLAYFEHPSYVPLLRRAYQLWRETEQLFGEQLLYVTGGLDIGAADGRVVTGSLAACAQHDLDHELIDAKELMRRFPGYRLAPDHVGNYQPDAGFVMSERAIVAQATMAMAAGAEIRAREPITGWEPTAGGGVRVTTSKGHYEAGRLILSTGAWIADHVPALANLAVPERQVLGWFQPRQPEHFKLGAFPVSVVQTAATTCYQFPVFGVPGFKIGLYNHLKQRGHADALSREPDAEDEAVLRAVVREVFPGADGATLALRACMFTNTPDEHFIIDTLPGHPQVVVASPCSGHGFKFASVVGEILADLATKGTTRHDLALFRLGRLA